MKLIKKKCVICRKQFEGYGHNPAPVFFHGRCCQQCNTNVVIPMRIMLMQKGGNNENA